MTNYVKQHYESILIFSISYFSIVLLPIFELSSLSFYFLLNVLCIITTEHYYFFFFIILLLLLVCFIIINFSFELSTPFIYSHISFVRFEGRINKVE